MATATQVHLTPSTPGVFPYTSIPASTSKTASTLLQQNHENNHIFFTASGLHNHIAHHLLSIFALSASAQELQKAYDNNAGYQREQLGVDSDVLERMMEGGDEKLAEFMGTEKNFRAFEAFFSKQIEQDPQGWQGVCNRYLFSGTPLAETLLGRMYSGFLHPVIHLGFGIEFAQPAIVVEALAQAAVHDDWIGRKYLFPVEGAASQKNASEKASIAELIDRIRGDEKLSNAPHWEDSNKIRDGLLVRAAGEMLDIAASYSLSSTPSQDELRKATAEMINACASFTLGAQWPGKTEKIDFFYMHSMNCSIFFSAIIEQEWISVEAKRRMLEWKVRMDLALYASRGCPKVDLERVMGYTGMSGKEESWDELFARANRYEDDGHLSKLIRALGNGEKACKDFEGEKGFVMKRDMWKRGAQMALDSVEGHTQHDSQDEEGPRWVRGAGFEEAWEKIPDLRVEGEGAKL